MIPTTSPFPRRQDLWQGALLATIGQAINVAAMPDLANERSWDGPNYSRQDSQGTRGTITFLADRLVGVIRDDHSPRAPWHSGGPYRLDPLLAEMPADLRTLAEAEALQYVLDSWENLNGPIITTAFWSTGEFLAAADPWPVVVEHGGHLLEIELMEPAAAQVAIAADSEWSPSQLNLLRSLFDRKQQTPNGPVTLKDWELRALVASGTSGLAESQALLTAIGFVFP